MRHALLLLNMFTKANEEEMPLDQKCAHLRSLRKESDEMDAQMDRALLEKISKLQAGLVEARKIQAELAKSHKELENALAMLTAPPLHPATFIEFHTIGGQRTALVSFENSQRFVVPSEELDCSTVRAGDQVLLSQDLNILVDKVSCMGLDCGETAIFERYSCKDRLILSRRGEEVVVYVSENLRNTQLKQGDEVRWSPTAMIALEKIDRSSGDKYFLEDTPQETFDAIGGLDRQIGEIKTIVSLRLEFPELAKKYHVVPPAAILLVGPPGTGKTMLARALANWLSQLKGSGRSHFINIKPSGLGSPYYTETEANIREVFRIAREAAALHPDVPVVIFFDEVDSIAAMRGTSYHHVDNRVVSSFAVELQGLENRGNILVVAATNRLDILDSALLRSGRLGDKVISVPRPNKEAARGILSKYLRDNMPYTCIRSKKARAREQIIESTLSRLYSANGESDVAVIRFRDGSQRVVKAGDLLSGASLANLVREATMSACLREIETGASGIHLQDMLSAVSKELESISHMLTPLNCRHHLSDLPQDMDVVSIEPVKRASSRALHYLQVA